MKHKEIFKMINELSKLYNTLMLIETKGENTKLMSNCIQYLEGLIAMEQQRMQAEATTEAVPAENVED